MNSYVIIFSALIVAVASNSIGRNTGWGAPEPYSIAVGSYGAAATDAFGHANADLQLTESAVGDAATPALIVSSSGILSEGEEAIDMVQVADVNTNSGASYGLQYINAENTIQGLQGVAAQVLGGVSANAAMSGSTEAEGSTFVIEG